MARVFDAQSGGSKLRSILKIALVYFKNIFAF